jgi:hypothetical protein
VDDESEQPLDQRSGAFEVFALGGVGVMQTRKPAPVAALLS